MNYKIVATDLDGTLLNTDQLVSPENEAAIKELTQMGVHVVASTGRALWEMPPEVRDNPYIRFIIHTDGASIYDKQTKKNINIPMTRAETDKMLDILSQYETSSSVRYDGWCFVDKNKHNDEDYAYNRVNPTYAAHLYRYAKEVDDLEKFSRELDSMDMICTFFHTDAERIECTARFEKEPEFQVASSVPNNIEVFSIKAGKGNALYMLADMLGIDRNATIAVGDTTNDSQALECAGLSLAMANSVPELKEIADEVICDNNNHAIKYILDHYFK